MTTLSAFVDRLDQRIPASAAAGWDAVGLQVGDPAASADRVAVVHEVTASVVDAAVAARTEVIVAYHPLIFEPLRRVVAGAGPAGLAWRLAAGRVGLVVVHTAFDVAPGGAADALAGDLGLAQIAGFGPMWGPDSVKVVTFAPESAVDAIAAAMADAGAGTIGGYTGCSFRQPGVGTFLPGATTNPTVGERGVMAAADEVRIEMVAPKTTRDAVVAALVAAHPYEQPAYDVYDRRGDAEFVGRVGEYRGDLDSLSDRVNDRLGGVVRVAGGVEGDRLRVAVVPGSGASLLGAARAAGADVVVTGDVKHHDARRATAAGMAVIDPGHAATERPGVARLYAAVAEVADSMVDLGATIDEPWRPPGGR